MEWLRRHWRWVIGIAVVVIAIGVLLSAFRSNPFCEFVITFFDDWSIALSAGAAVILAGAAFLTIWNVNERVKRDRKERLLNEIIKWAEETNEISLTPDIPVTSRYVPLMRKQREANELLRYGISMSKVPSIETIASEGFKHELLQDVKKVAETLAKFICIRQLKSLGVLPTEEAMPGKSREEIKQEVEEGKKSVDQIWQYYATELSDRISELLIRANVIKASLLK